MYLRVDFMHTLNTFNVLKDKRGRKDGCNFFQCLDKINQGLLLLKRDLILVLHYINEYSVL